MIDLPHLDIPLGNTVSFRPTSWSPQHDGPSPEEIRQRCAEIQATWDEPEERLRRTGTSEKPPLEIAVVPIGGRVMSPFADRLSSYSDSSSGGGEEWGDNRRKKLSESDVRKILASDEPNHVLAARFRVSATNILAIKQRRTWRHVPLEKEAG